MKDFLYPDDIYTEAETDPNTLANLGPLADVYKRQGSSGAIGSSTNKTGDSLMQQRASCTRAFSPPESC